MDENCACMSGFLPCIGQFCACMDEICACLNHSRACVNVAHGRAEPAMCSVLSGSQLRRLERLAVINVKCPFIEFFL
jgi:hypothetical protein